MNTGAEIHGRVTEMRLFSAASPLCVRCRSCTAMQDRSDCCCESHIWCTCAAGVGVGVSGGETHWPQEAVQVQIHSHSSNGTSHIFTFNQKIKINTHNLQRKLFTCTSAVYLLNRTFMGKKNTQHLISCLIIFNDAKIETVQKKSYYDLCRWCVD